MYITCPLQENFEKRNVKRFENGYVKDTWLSVDIQDFVKIDGIVTDIQEGVT